MFNSSHPRTIPAGRHESRSTRAAWLVLAAAILAAGCGKPLEPWEKVYAATGVVHYRGQRFEVVSFDLVPHRYDQPEFLVHGVECRRDLLQKIRHFGLVNGIDLLPVDNHTAGFRLIEAAEQVVATEGIEVEVVDPRTLSPLDWDTLVSSVEKTGRLVVAHEAPRTGGPGGELVASLVERCFYALRSPPQRVAGADVVYPPQLLEDAYLPDADRIAEALRAVMED